MTVSLLITGDSDDLLALEAALRNDPAIKGALLDRVVRESEADEMGPAVEALTWISDHKDLVIAVAGAITAWIERRRTTVRIRTGEREIEVSAYGVRDAETLAKALLRPGEDGEAPTAPGTDA